MSAKGIKATLTILLILTLLILTGCELLKKPKNLEKNYGHSYGEISIGSDSSQEFSAEDVVPTKAELIANLESAGFSIAKYNQAPDSDIAAERIYAVNEKEGHYIDICYGITIEQAKEIFEEYESIHSDYYLLAQNGPYFYAVSDAKTFELAGFESLETDGILFIWK